MCCLALGVVWCMETMDYLMPCLIVSVVWGVETMNYLMPCSCQCLSDCVCDVGCGDCGLPHALLLSVLV